MSNIELLQKINKLDDELKNEAVDFIEFLIQKKGKSPVKKHPKAGFLKNTFVIKDGFDDIPECFKDYIK